MTPPMIAPLLSVSLLAATAVFDGPGVVEAPTACCVVGVEFPLVVVGVIEGPGALQCRVVSSLSYKPEEMAQIIRDGGVYV